MAENLEHYGRPVVLVSITAPGEDQLPWDEAHCAHRRPHRHRGPSGCRVRQREAREWSETVTWRWSMLRRAAAIATRRRMRDELGLSALGPMATLLERVWEPQKRGVPHLHLVLGFGSPSEIRAATIFAHELERLAPEYLFGFVDTRLKPITAADAARYLSSYLTGRSTKKGSIRENISDPVMPRSLIWLTPRLTRLTFVTMRTLRRARHLYAAVRGICEPPKWLDALEVVRVALICRRIYARGDDDEDPIDEAGALAFAGQLQAAYDRAPLRWYQERQVESLNVFAFSLAGIAQAA